MAGNLDRSLDLYHKAQELNPNHAPSYANYGFTQILNGNPGMANQWIERALRISPRDPLVAIWRSEEALAAIAANPNHPPPCLYAGVALERPGRLEEAQAMMLRHARIRPDWTIAKQKESTRGSARFDRLAASLLDDLRSLGLPEH